MGRLDSVKRSLCSLRTLPVPSACDSNALVLTRFLRRRLRKSDAQAEGVAVRECQP